MKLKFFVAACLVVGGALFKAGAPLPALIAGMMLAAVVMIMRLRVKPARISTPVAKAR
jgi:hypothetical protein